VVQQAQGRVRPTTQMKDGVQVNDDVGLEGEAEVMGAKAVQMKSGMLDPRHNSTVSPAFRLRHVMQRAVGYEFETGWQAWNASAPNVQARPPTTSATIQRRPADWAGSADFVRMLGHAHGLFSTWKKIKAQIRAYSNLGDAQLDERRTALHTIRDLIAEWETDPKHTAASTEQRVLDIRADMPQLKAYVSREFTEVAIATDAITGGHAETRHGADLTDDQLIHRLTSGVDRAGAAAATDTSSRFATHELLLQTKTAAVNQLDAARTTTIAHFINKLINYIEAWNTFETTPAGPAKGVAGAARTAARQAVHNAAAIGVIPVPSPNMLRVDVNNPAYGGVAAAPGTLADIQGRVRGMLDTKNRYKIVINHGRNMGPSFAGTGPAGGPHPGGAVAPATQRTMTILQPGVVNLLIAPAAATWATITHYPCDPAEPVGISP
jgi:hypothetical protein